MSEYNLAVAQRDLDELMAKLRQLNVDSLEKLPAQLRRKISTRQYDELIVEAFFRENLKQVKLENG